MQWGDVDWNYVLILPRNQYILDNKTEKQQQQLQGLQGEQGQWKSFFIPVFYPEELGDVLFQT